MDTKLVIAVVEDHDDLREAMAEVLTNQGHTVLPMPTAESYAEMVIKSPIDLAIIDINLPGEDGISLTKRLRHACPTLGIIIVSARGLVQEKTQGYESGADIYLTKPVALQELAAAVQSLGHRLKTPSLAQGPSLSFACLSLTGLNGQFAQISWNEAVLLRSLILSKNKQVEYWQLMESMGKNPDVYAKSALELIVVRLRKRMRSVGYEAGVITAVRNKGYKLLTDIDLI
jgi:DNA-binding response OmpR family regulator